MKVLSGSWTAWLSTLALQPRFWLWICLVAALAAVAGVLAEWQRRTTLLALIRNAPAGTVVIQERGRGGPAMHVRVGSSPEATDDGGRA
ncbi:hypothetical protein ACFYOD_35995 [Streptomyces sp. NPDC006703]|uniref:hypothetical protein n=1 Tax=Streptomyces sp. NPDC006703 TaxID=3364759 RepID=UPI0036C3C958